MGLGGPGTADNTPVWSRWVVAGSAVVGIPEMGWPLSLSKIRIGDVRVDLRGFI